MHTWLLVAPLGVYKAFEKYSRQDILAARTLEGASLLWQRHH